MNPALSEHRKAQAAPNSAGSPIRFAGIDSGPLRLFLGRGRAVPRRRRLRHRRDAGGVERSGQQAVDRDVRSRHLPRDARDEPGQAGARAARQVEAGERHLHRTRGDVDHATETARDHAGQHRLDQQRRRHEIRLHPGADAVGVELGIGFHRRAAIVVDQNIGVGTCGEQRGAPRLARKVGDHLRHRHPGFGADRVGGRGQLRRVASVDDDIDPGPRQFERACAAKPGARRAHDRPAAGNSQIHVRSPISSIANRCGRSLR